MATKTKLPKLSEVVTPEFIEKVRPAIRKAFEQISYDLPDYEKMSAKARMEVVLDADYITMYGGHGREVRPGALSGGETQKLLREAYAACGYDKVHALLAKEIRL